MGILEYHSQNSMTSWNLNSYTNMVLHSHQCTSFFHSWPFDIPKWRSRFHLWKRSLKTPKKVTNGRTWEADWSSKQNFTRDVGTIRSKNLISTCVDVTLLKFNSSPLRSYLPKRKVVFQTSFFRDYVIKLRESNFVVIFGHVIWVTKDAPNAEIKKFVSSFKGSLMY